MLHAFPPRSRAHLLLAGALAPLVVVGVVHERRAAEEAWTHALEGLAVVEESVNARFGERPVLWGDRTDDEADPHYARALALVHGWDPHEVVDARRAKDDAGRKIREALVARGAEALAALHSGAHAATYAPAVEWEEGWQLNGIRLMDSRHLVQLAGLKAELEFAAGRDLEAVGWLLDGMQLAADLCRAPRTMIEEMIGIALLSPEVLLDRVADGRIEELSPAARERLLVGMRTLDQRLGWEPTSLGTDLLLLAYSIERGRVGDLEQDADLLAILEPIRTSIGLRRASRCIETWTTVANELSSHYASGPDGVASLYDSLLAQGQEPDPFLANVTPKLATALRSRAFQVGRFRLLLFELEGAAPKEVDPWIAGLVRETVGEEGEPLLTIEHELFEDGAWLQVSR